MYSGLYAQVNCGAHYERCTPQTSQQRTDTYEQGVRMDLDNDSYSNERSRNDLALRMIRHEARTCTIRECTGLTDDRIRRLYKSYAHELSEAPVRRHRGKSPRQVTFFVRNTRAQFESSLLAGSFAAFGLLLQ